jgi:hypothetical protein
LVYYSDEKHDLDNFFEENKGLIPYSYDGFDDKKNVLKSTYFYQFESYFEISTDSYFFKDIKTAYNRSARVSTGQALTKSFLTPIGFGVAAFSYRDDINL